MRRGLVVLGGLLAVLGVAALLAFNLIPTTSERREGYSTAPQPYGPNATGSTLLPGTDADRGTFSISWRATAPIDVTLYPAAGCTEPSASCATGPAVATWKALTSGAWSVSGGLHFPYLIAWSESSSNVGNFTASGVESTDVTVPPNVLDTLLVDGAAASLAVIGGIAVFLGLFLRSGVYRGPTPIVSRSAEDVEAISNPPGPPGR
jgi:hypothetical protein